MPHPRRIKIVTCNFEQNGFGSRALWLDMHQRLAKIKPTILCRQENPGHAESGAGSTLFNESKRIVGLAGRLGPGLGATALYYDPEVFTEITTWETHWPNWLLHPTAMTLRVNGTENIDMVTACGHLSYNSAALREIQADDVTRFADRVVTYEHRGQRTARKLPVLGIGMDCNSYVDPARLVVGETPIPRLDQIADLQHRAHRSYETANGQRVMDSRPDRTMLIAGLEDAARHVALAQQDATPVAPTVDASETHGPAHRVDRIYTGSLLLPALVSVEVVDMKGLSDHHTVAAVYDLDLLVEVYHSHYELTA